MGSLGCMQNDSVILVKLMEMWVYKQTETLFYNRCTVPTWKSSKWCRDSV